MIDGFQDGNLATEEKGRRCKERGIPEFQDRRSKGGQGGRERQEKEEGGKRIERKGRKITRKESILLQVRNNKRLEAD